MPPRRISRTGSSCPATHAGAAPSPAARASPELCRKKSRREGQSLMGHLVSGCGYRDGSDIADVAVGLEDRGAPPRPGGIFPDGLEVQLDAEARRVGDLEVAVLELHRLPHHLAE